MNGAAGVVRGSDWAVSADAGLADIGTDTTSAAASAIAPALRTGRNGRRSAKKRSLAEPIRMITRSPAFPPACAKAGRVRSSSHTNAKIERPGKVASDRSARLTGVAAPRASTSAHSSATGCCGPQGASSHSAEIASYIWPFVAYSCSHILHTPVLILCRCPRSPYWTVS